jgi:endonuclease YncB( thermonuclease family)
MDYSKIVLPTVIKRVIDGDTIVVDIDHLLNIYSKNIRIRLAGIDAQSLKTQA